MVAIQISIDTQTKDLCCEITRLIKRVQYVRMEKSLKPWADLKLYVHEQKFSFFDIPDPFLKCDVL